MDTDKLVRVYLKMRDKRTELKRAYEEEDNKLKANMSKIETTLLSFLNDHKMDNSSTKDGSFYREETMIPTGADWEAFYQFVKQEDAFEFLEKRITKKAVKDYMEAHGGTPPPGVSVYREFVCRVRRK
jgi:hypothetical protein